MKEYQDLYDLLVAEHGRTRMSKQEIIKIRTYAKSEWRDAMVSIEISVVSNGKRYGNATMLHLDEVVHAHRATQSMVAGTLRRIRETTSDR